MPEVILFSGPPFSGKTLYYLQHLKSSHKRLSSSELHRAHPGWGLRNVTQLVVTHLKDGVSVVLDDEHWQRKTRVSIIQNIKAKVPTCTFACYVFRPKEALECFWRREWIIAKCFLLRDESGSRLSLAEDLTKTESRIDKWFSHESGDQISGLDAVTEGEGWHRVRDIETRLVAQSDYKFEVPALLLDWKAITSESHNELIAAMRVWIEHAVCGRLLVLAELHNEAENQKHSDDSEMEEQYEALMKKIKEHTQELSRRLETPVYYLVIKDQLQSGCFTKSPKSGVLSLLQCMHHVDLHHGGTVYVYHSSSRNPARFEQSGIKQLNSRAVCRNPSLLAVSHGGQISSLAHSSITEIEYVGESQNSLPHIPLYKEICRQSSDCRTYVAEGMFGRVIGVSYPDKQSLEKFQNEYAACASQITQRGTKMTFRPLDSDHGKTAAVDRDQSEAPAPIRHSQHSGTSSALDTKSLPSWMRRKRRSNENGGGKGVQEGREKEGLVSPFKMRNEKRDAPGNNASAPPKTVYCMSVEELREIAKRILGEADSLESDGCPVVESSNGPRENANSDLRSGDEVAMESRDEEEEEEGGMKDVEIGRDGLKDEKHEADGVESIIADLFTSETGHRKPPPNKKTIRSPGTITSAMLWSSDEESPCQPEPSSAHNQTPLDMQGRGHVQDLSFLDEIF